MNTQTKGKTLSKKAIESLEEIKGLIESTPIMAWMISHGLLRESLKSKAVKALFPGLSEEEVKRQYGVCKHALSVAYDRGLFNGAVTGVRGFASGNLVASMEGTAFGRLLADAMDKTVRAAQAAITNGEFPRMLLLPSSSKKDVLFRVDEGGPEWKLDYRLTKAALGLAKVNSEELLGKLLAAVADNADTKTPSNVEPMPTQAKGKASKKTA